MKINTAIIGFGMSARVFHSPLIEACEEFHIKTVYSSNEDKVLEKIPYTKATNSIEEIFEDSEIDLIVICGPNHTHYDLTKQALIKGINVVVEKPFVASVNEGKELIEIAKKQNKILSVFHNRRWDCDFLAVKDIIKNNQLGDIQLFETFYDRWRPITRDGKWREKPGVATGILYDLGSHLIDQVIELFGVPQAVFGDIVDQKENYGIDDYFHLILKYDKTRVIIRGNSFSLSPQRFHILGNKANYLKTGIDPQAEKLDQGIDPLSSNFGKEDHIQSGKLITPDGERLINSPHGNYMSYYKQLAEAIKENNPQLNPVKPQDALQVIKIIELAIKSNNQKKWINYEDD